MGVEAVCMARLGPSALLCVLGLAAVTRAQAPDPVDFPTEIAPLLEASCDGAFCHIGLRTSGLELSDYDTLVESVGERYARSAVVPFRAERSPLWEKIALEEPSEGQRMPLAREALDVAAVARVERWLNEGARPTRDAPALLRGDVDQSRGRNLLDALLLLESVLGRGQPVECTPVADVNADGTVDLADVLRLLNHIFGHQEPLSPLLRADYATCS